MPADGDVSSEGLCASSPPISMAALQQRPRLHASGAIRGASAGQWGQGIGVGGSRGAAEEQRRGPAGPLRSPGATALPLAGLHRQGCL